MYKQYNSPKELIKVLRKRNLIINDVKTAEIMLKNLGYFPFITAYKAPFLISKPHEPEIYITGTTIEDLYDLYTFDSKLRNIIRDMLNDIELYIRQVVIRKFIEELGDHQNVYLDIKSFSAIPPKDKNKLLNNLRYTTTTDDNPSKYYRESYGEVPLWVSCQMWDFGTLQKFYKYSKPIIKTRTVRELLDIHLAKKLTQQQKASIFGESLELMRKFRNRVSHGYRTYNYRPQNKDSEKNVIPTISYYRYFQSNILSDHEEYNDGYIKSGSIWTLLNMCSIFEEKSIMAKGTNQILDLCLDFLSYHPELDFFILDSLGYPPSAIARFVKNTIERNKLLIEKGIISDNQQFTYFEVSPFVGIPISNNIAKDLSGYMSPKVY